MHVVINDKGEIINFAITPGNVDDRDLSVIAKVTHGLWGKLFGDRGYIQKTFPADMYRIRVN